MLDGSADGDAFVGRIGRTDEVDEEEHARTDVEDLRAAPAPRDESKDAGNETDREMKPVFMKGLFRYLSSPPRTIEFARAEFGV